MLILLLALIARFRYISEIEHNIDHAYTVWQAMTTLDRGVLPLAGQGTSVLFANPPLTGYLFIPAVALTRSPLGVYVFIIALNWLAVWMTYRAVRGLLGANAGLIAAALMAVNPWVIEYSRTAWVQSLLPFFMCAIAWLLWPVLLRQTPRPARRLLLALVITALFTQTYLLAFFIIVPVTLLLLLYRRRLPMRALALGVAFFAFTTSLYGFGLLNQASTVRDRVESFSSGDSRLSFEALDSAVRLVSGGDYEIARGLDAPINDSTLRHDLSQVAHAAIVVAMLAGAGFALYAIIRKTPQRDNAVIMLLWFALPVIVMSYTGNPVHPFYQFLGVPAGYALAAWGISALLRWRYATYALLLVFLPFATLMLTNSARYYQETAAIPGVHGFGALPVDYGMTLGKAIRNHRTQAQPVFLDEQEWTINSFSGGLFSVIQDTRSPALTRIPASGALYVTMGQGAAAPLGGTRDETIALPDGQDIHIYTLPPADRIPPPGNVLNVPSAQGLTLVGYNLTQQGDTYTLTIQWRVDAINPEVLSRIYAPFIHLFDATGERVAIVDGEGLRGDNWMLGALHIHQMPFTLPADYNGPFTLVVGQFDGVNNANIVFLPAASEPSVVVPLPEVLGR